MPTYQYECSACNHEFEILQTMLAKKLKKCPECGKNKLHRLIGSGSGIIFKGSGFYETDYKKGSPKSNKVESSATSTDKKTESPASSKSTKETGSTTQKESKD